MSVSYTHLDVYKRQVLQIDEVHFQGSDGEFIALINLGNDSVSLLSLIHI